MYGLESEVPLVGEELHKLKQPVFGERPGFSSALCLDLSHPSLEEGHPLNEVETFLETVDLGV